ncbi:MAG: hypothetical protein, partial [Olavius algarvensis Gamma 3 endosymbiont]
KYLPCLRWQTCICAEGNYRHCRV